MKHPIVLDERGKIKRTFPSLFDRKKLNELFQFINNVPLQVSHIYMTEEEYKDIVDFGMEIK